MICLVTDRRRLTAGSPVRWRDCLLDQVRFAVEARVDLVQVRERDLEAATLAELVAAILTLTAGSGTRVIVNERLDVAVACGADGVHLRGDSIPVSDARRLAPAGFLVGRSVHSLEDAVLAAGADYLVAGTVFPSVSKPSATGCLGVEGLARIVQAVRTPVLAIGGVTAAGLDDLAATGAAGIAAIGLFMRAGEEEPAGGGASCRAISLHDQVTRLRARFDSVHTRP